MRATYSASTWGMHHIFLRHGLRWFSASRRRTVSRDRSSCAVSLTISSASRSTVQRARPAGGFEQAVATSSAYSLPVSLRSAPGRGSSLSARSRLPSTNRRLVRYTVEPPTPSVAAISSSATPASPASRILPACRRTEVLPTHGAPIGSGRHDSVHSSQPPGWRPSRINR